MSKFLFFPWSHGVGFGYFGRCLVLAALLRDVGHECIFATDTPEMHIKRSGFGVESSGGTQSVAVPDMGEKRGHYIPIDNMDTVYGISKYYHPQIVKDHTVQDIGVIEHVQPDAIVIDMQPTASIAARHMNLPLLSLADADFLYVDDNSWMNWISADQLRNLLPYPSCLSAFNKVMTDYNLAPIEHVTDLLWGNLTLIASIPEVEPDNLTLKKRSEAHFVGPIYWDPPWQEAHLPRRYNNEECVNIYVTLGHGGKVNRDYLQAVFDGCHQPGWQVFASLGFRPPELLDVPPNVHIGGFTGIERPIQWADIVIGHGGHATTLVSVLFAKPSIILPLMSEQEANGHNFVEQLGAGFLLRKTRLNPGTKRFEWWWRYSGVSSGDIFLAEDVRRGVQEVLDVTRYRQNARRLGSVMERYINGRDLVALAVSILK